MLNTWILQIFTLVQYHLIIVILAAEPQGLAHISVSLDMIPNQCSSPILMIFCSKTILNIIRLLGLSDSWCLRYLSTLTSAYLPIMSYQCFIHQLQYVKSRICPCFCCQHILFSSFKSVQYSHKMNDSSGNYFLN
jgi:hypothetical protein